VSRARHAIAARFGAAVVIVALAGCTSDAAPPATSGSVGTTTPASVAGKGIELTRVAEADEPIVLAWRPGDPVGYLAQRDGIVRRLTADGLGAEVLDLSGRTVAGGERGLLGMAFAPDGTHVYVHYTDLDGTTTLDELAVRADGTIDAGSRRTLLTQRQPYPNHNGGELTFGPDGLLYLGLGDGGSGGDPERRGLDLSTWLGKILRIDPTPSADQPYTVPADNPFVGKKGARPEIWAYGLRNPWRFSFDRTTGDLWISDVGQGAIEEVDVARSPAAGRGYSFGWSAYEGTHRFNADQQAPDAVMPFHEYPHGDLGCSITGGFVYRGQAVPALQGHYVFGDYCSAGLRAIDVTGGPVADAERLTDAPGQISAFGESPDGELYVLSLEGGVYRVDPAS
jgi:glucose/arabinose dehydrogenase